LVTGRTFRGRRGGVVNQGPVSFRPFWRIAARQAIVAVAHAILIMAHQMLKHKEVYRERGENNFDHINPEETSRG
jgi:hypothetical protein